MPVSGKRNRVQNKMLKNKMLKRLDAMLGEQDSGLFIALILDLLEKLVAGREEAEMRTIEIILNGFFSVKYDFIKEELL